MKLIFVYNATLNPAGLIKDFISEILPQGDANCKLCDITYSLVFKKRAWKDYLDSIGMESKFYLKDQFIRKHDFDPAHQFPCTFLEDDAGSLQEFIPADEINTVDDLEQLIRLVRQKLEELPK